MAESTTHKYPFTKFRYKVEFGGTDTASFSEVSGFDASIDVVEYREGDMRPTPMKVQGLTKYGNVTLKWGLTDSKKFYEWMSSGLEGAVVRKETISISLLNEAGTAVASWQVINAWPTKYTAPDFNATASEVAIETLEIAHEGMTRTL